MPVEKIWVTQALFKNYFSSKYFKSNLFWFLDIFCADCLKLICWNDFFFFFFLRLKIEQEEEEWS